MVVSLMLKALLASMYHYKSTLLAVLHITRCIVEHRLCLISDSNSTTLNVYDQIYVETDRRVSDCTRKLNIAVTYQRHAMLPSQQ